VGQLSTCVRWHVGDDEMMADLADLADRRLVRNGPERNDENGAEGGSLPRMIVTTATEQEYTRHPIDVSRMPQYHSS